MSDKDAYRSLVQEEGVRLPLFCRDWWLDAVCGPGHWDAAVVDQGGAVAGALPYYARRRLGLTLLVQPPLTPTLGPWVRETDAGPAGTLERQKRVMTALIDRLPPFAHFEQGWHHGVTNWLPFHWRGFAQTTRYTYVLPDLRDEAALWGALRENIRREIRKAEGRHGLTVRASESLSELHDLNRKTFARQGRPVPYAPEVVERIDGACRSRGCRRIWIAEDGEGRAHAGAYVVWDEDSAYYLIGGGDPELRTSGATSLCLWHAIRHAAAVTRRFDFEGSMLEPVERFFRAFGARQVPYHLVSKTPSRLWRLRRFMHRPAG